MKRTLMLALIALLATGSALAAAGDQDKNERPRRTTAPSSGYLGVGIDEVTHEEAQRLRLREERGALITDVTSDTAAAKAGLLKDDVIVRWNGEAVESACELTRHLRETPGGRNVKLGVVRNGSEMELTVTLGSRNDYAGYMRAIPAAPIAPAAPLARVAPAAPLARITPATPAAPRARLVPSPMTVTRANAGYQLGIALQRMSPQLAEYFGLQNRSGALVTFVHPDSAAARAGIKAGDVILSIDGESIDNPQRVAPALLDKGKGAVEVRIMRDRQERKVTVQLDKKTSLVWSPFENADVVLSEGLTEPLEIGPINIEPLTIAPMAMPQVQIAPLPPMTVPRIAIPKLSIPKTAIPPMRIVMPEIVFRTEV